MLVAEPGPVAHMSLVLDLPAASACASAALEEVCVDARAVGGDAAFARSGDVIGVGTGPASGPHPLGDKLGGGRTTV